MKEFLEEVTGSEDKVVFTEITMILAESKIETKEKKEREHAYRHTPKYEQMRVRPHTYTHTDTHENTRRYNRN